MTPETFIALLLVLCVLGVLGLGVAVFFLRKKEQERFESLTHLLDQLDERTIHENRTLEKKTEEIRKDVGKSQASFQEDLEARLSESRDVWQKGYDEIKRILENLVAEQRHLRQELEEDLQTKIDRGLEDLSEHHQKQTALLAGYDQQVQRVRMRNELQVAITFFHAGNPDKAFEVLEPLIAEDPENRDAILLAARASLSSGQADRGAELLETALARFPGDPDLLSEFARIRATQGNAGERSRLIAEGLVRHPENPRLRFERALQHIENNNYPAAKEDLLAVTENETGSAEVYYNLGIVEMHLGNVPGAIHQLRKSISLSPGSAEGNHALGLALMAGEAYPEAVDFLTRARNLKPEHIRSRLDLASALRLAGSPEDAIKECRVARRLDPRVPRTELEEALARHDHAEFRESLELLDNLLQWQPAYKNARRLKAEILMETERLEEAIREWSTLTEQSPDDPEIKVALADAVKRNGQGEAALGWFELAARMAPAEVSIQLRFAKEALALQKFERVEETLERVVPIATSAESQLQIMELRMLIVLKDGKFSQLDRLLIELKRILEAHPEAVPLEKRLDLEGQTLLALGLSKEAAKIHNALIDLYDGEIDYETLDDIVTQVMRSLLPPTPPRPEPVETAAGDNGQQVEDAPAAEEQSEGVDVEPTVEEETVGVAVETDAELTTEPEAEPAEAAEAPEEIPETITPEDQPEVVALGEQEALEISEEPESEPVAIAESDVEAEPEDAKEPEEATREPAPPEAAEIAPPEVEKPQALVEEVMENGGAEEEESGETEEAVKDLETSEAATKAPARRKRSKKPSAKKGKKNTPQADRDS